MRSSILLATRLEDAVSVHHNRSRSSARNRYDAVLEMRCRDGAEGMLSTKELVMALITAVSFLGDLKSGHFDVEWWDRNVPYFANTDVAWKSITNYWRNM